MNEKEVKEYLEQRGLSWSYFLRWIQNQSITSDENGNPIFLTGDVKNYVKEMYSDLSFSGIVNLTQEQESRSKVLNTIVDFYLEADSKINRLEKQLDGLVFERNQLHNGVHHLLKILKLGPVASYLRDNEMVYIDREEIKVRKILRFDRK